MVCHLCQLEPVYKLPNKKLCKRCFIKYFEKKVFKTIRNYSLFNLDDKICIATSGGKDSITVLYLTHKYLKRKNLEKNLFALVVDEGILNYREKTIKFLENFCQDLKIELKKISFKENFGKTLDQSIKILQKKKSNVSACNICGTFRRYCLNKIAKENLATKLVTGHNGDDEAQNILLNIFKNNYSILARLGPKTGIVENIKFVKRVKPLYFMLEKEVRLYTILKGFDVGFDECPYSNISFRHNISKCLNMLENNHVGVKNSILNFYLNIEKELKNKFILENKVKTGKDKKEEKLYEKQIKENQKNNISCCQICSEPSEKKICNTCFLKKLILDK